MSLGARLAHCAGGEDDGGSAPATVGGVTIRQRSPEQQRKHEQLADRARERAVVRQPAPESPCWLNQF